ncbi:MAG: transporter substrate-binding domain-containing protein [Eubacterium sp.]|nr:transporter substrate-binding domain-containing protein [Eubacterium sp.]
MKNMKKVVAVLLSAIFVMLCFAGCSSSNNIAEEITDKTMLIAYTAEKAPFIYTGEDGNLTGFDVELMGKIFNNIKYDYKNYKFVQVEEDYRIGEDTAYTDEDGNDYIAYVMVGGIEKNTGSFNKDHTFTKDIIDNRVIAVTTNDSKISTYADLGGVNAGVVSDTAMTALDKNAVIKDGMKSVKDYADAASAIADLKAGKIDVIIIDEFTFNVTEGIDGLKVLDSELDTISYVYAFQKWDWIEEAYNEAIYELKSAEYNDADEFTPIVEKYFGYNASNFDFKPTQD